MSRRNSYNHCPNCDKKFIFRPDQRWCDDNCEKQFWYQEYLNAQDFLMDKDLFREFGEWCRAHRSGRPEATDKGAKI